MKNFKKILGIFLAMTLLLGSMLALASCGDKGGDGDKPTPCTHVDVDDNGKCDNCAADFEDGKDLPDLPAATPAYVTYTVTVKSGDKVVKGATVKLVAADGESGVEKVTDNKGKVVFEPAPGEWKVQLIALPDGYAEIEDYTAIDFDADNTAVFVVEAK